MYHPTRTMTTLLNWLADRFPSAKRTTLRRMLADRRIAINGLPPANMNAIVAEGDTVTIAPRPITPTVRHRSDQRLRIIFEDDDVLVVDKPAGLLTSTTARERRTTLLQIVREEMAARRPDARVGVIHRLDREARGLLVFSLNDSAYRALKSQFFHHSVDRVYAAVVEGAPAQKQRTLRSFLVELPDGRVRSTAAPGKGQKAVSDFEIVRAGLGRRRALLRVTLFTGRKHQIRAHLSEAGHPIVGDAMYDPTATRPSKPAVLHLQAAELGFDHPRTGQRMRFQLPLPDEFAAAVDAKLPAARRRTGGGQPAVSKRNRSKQAGTRKPTRRATGLQG